MFIRPRQLDTWREHTLGESLTPVLNVSGLHAVLGTCSVFLPVYAVSVTHTECAAYTVKTPPCEFQHDLAAAVERNGWPSCTLVLVSLLASNLFHSRVCNGVGRLGATTALGMELGWL